MWLEEFNKLQKNIKKYEKLRNEIFRIQNKFEKEMINKTYIYDGKECYISYMNFESNKINLNEKQKRGTRVDWVVKKQLTFEEFFELFFKEEEI